MKETIRKKERKKDCAAKSVINDDEILVYKQQYNIIINRITTDTYKWQGNKYLTKVCVINYTTTLLYL